MNRIQFVDYIRQNFNVSIEFLRLLDNYNNFTQLCQAFFRPFRTFFRRKMEEFGCYTILSKSLAGCLHQGQMKSSGSSPSCT